MDKVVLVVEDDPGSLRLIRLMLELSGYVTLEAADGRQAVEVAKSDRPDLILMDVMMPVMDGYSACSAIKNDEATRDIPIVILSAVAFELNKKLANSLGADGYITKPFAPQELLGAVNLLLPAGESLN